MNDNNFWLTIWGMLFITVILIIAIPVISHYNNVQELCKQGYEEKVILIRPGGDFIQPVYEKVWVKKDTTPTLGNATTVLEKK